MEPNIAWHVSMVVPAVMFVICAICMKLMCWDMLTTRHHDPAVTGKTQRSMWDYVEVLRDVRVVVTIFQYSACLSTELAKSKHLVNALVGVARSLSVVAATADADSTNVEAGLRTAVAGFGMLVGICWDKAFETVAEDTVMASTTTSGRMVS